MTRMRRAKTRKTQVKAQLAHETDIDHVIVHITRSIGSTSGLTATKDTRYTDLALVVHDESIHLSDSNPGAAASFG